MNGNIFLTIIAIYIQLNFSKIPDLYIRQSSGDLIYLKSKQNRKCLMKSKIDGQVLYGTCSFDNINQKIKIEIYEGFILFRSIDNQVFDISARDYRVGNYIQFWNVHFGGNQLWKFESSKIYNWNDNFCLSAIDNVLTLHQRTSNQCHEFEYGSWYDCPVGCLCDFQKICLRCNTDIGYYGIDSANNTPCYQSIEGYFINSPNKFFSKCLTGCKTCNITSCEKCFDGFFLYLSNSCVSTCPDEYYGDTNGICYPCVNQCNKCPNGKCTLCKSGFFLNLNNECRSCILNCENCSNSTECSKCTNNTFLSIDKKNCLISCPSEKFFGDIIQMKCLNCIDNCDKCSNSTECIRCSLNYFNNDNDNCSSSIPIKYFGDSNTRKWVKCQENCDICENSFECIKCSLNYFNYDKDRCSSPTPLKYFGDTNTRKWMKCPDNCDICENSFECIYCSENFFNYNKDSCSSPTPIKYFGDSNTRKWVKCLENCDICENSFECIYCTEKFFNHNIDSCSSPNPIKYFGDSNTRKWMNCVDNCDVCQNNYECLICSTSFYFYPEDSKLCNLCPIGYYADQITKKCLRCSKNCDSCFNNSECKICSLGYYNLENSCVSNCPDGRYENKELSICSKCSKLCKKCENDSEYCLECTDDSFILLTSINSDLNKKCVKSCPENYKADINKVCKTCKELNLYIMDNQCVDTCDADFYKDMETLECVLCNKEEEYIYQDMCLKNCPENNFADPNRICVHLECTDQCKNGGECYIEEYKLKCKCTTFFEGDFCEIEIPYSPDKINLDDPITPKAIEFFDKIKDEILVDPTKLTPEIKGKITDLANNQIELVNKGIIQPDPGLLNIFATALTMNTINTESETQSKEAVKNLKANMSKFVDAIIDKVEIKEATSIIKPEFAVQFFPTDPTITEEATKLAVKNNKSVIDASSCENILKKKNSIPENMNLIVKKIDMSSKLNITALNDTTRENSDSVIYEYFNPLTKAKLDISVCKNATVTVKAANTKVVSKMNLTSYKRLAETGLDMLNPNSKAYHSRCIPIKDPVTGKDASVGYRNKTYFQGKSAECAANCDYKGLDDNGYVICECKGLMDTETKANSMVSKGIDLELPQMNLDIIFCFYEVMHYPEIFFNLGFYANGFFILISILIYLFQSNSGYHLIEKKLNDVINNDCTFFDPEEMTIREYFDHNKIKREKNVDLYKRIQDNIENVKVIKLRKIGKLKNKPFKENSNINNNEDKIVSIPVKLSNFKINNMHESSSSKRDHNENSTITHSEDRETALKFKKSLEWKVKLEEKNPKKIDPKYSFNKDPSPIEDIKIYKNRPYKLHVYYRFPDHVPTLKDFECLSPVDAVVCDERKFSVVLLQLLIEEHVLFSLIFRNSLMYPKWIEIVSVCFNINIMLSLNALFFSDEYIDQRVSPETDV